MCIVSHSVNAWSSPENEKQISIKKIFSKTNLITAATLEIAWRGAQKTAGSDVRPLPFFTTFHSLVSHPSVHTNLHEQNQLKYSVILVRPLTIHANIVLCIILRNTFLPQLLYSMMEGKVEQAMESVDMLLLLS